MPPRWGFSVQRGIFGLPRNAISVQRGTEYGKSRVQTPSLQRSYLGFQGSGTPPKAVSYPQEAEGTSLKADSPILGSNRPASGPYVNEQANGLEPQPRTRLSGSVRPTPYDRSVLSMPATSAGVTLGT